MSILTEEEEHKFQNCYTDLKYNYGSSLTKLELAHVLSCKENKISTMMRCGTSPRFKKLGDSKQSRVIFDAYDVAMFQTCGKMMRDYGCIS